MAPPRRRPSARTRARAAARATPRAPRRPGARTTLRVPDDLAETVARYAEQHRTSTNDALVRLAYDGARTYEHRREADELARIRGEAILSAVPAPSGVVVPSADETTAAILAWRRGELD